MLVAPPSAAIIGVDGRASALGSVGSNSMHHPTPKIECLIFAVGFLSALLGGCHPSRPLEPAAGPISNHSPYPAHWWTPVSREGAPAWEILPQEAGPGEVVLSKRNELGVLSNFAATPFVFRDKRYASLEGFWQMMLYPEDNDDPRAQFPGLEWKYPREQVAEMTSFEAKNAGTLAEENMRRMGIRWVTFEGQKIEYRPATPGEHYRLIVAATWEKVRQNPEVKRILLSTGNLALKPDHHQEPNAPAAWRYYEILTQIRGELQKQH
jgi:predicted NAD-dependent protein-ADP-ribosyltransferase YbiA (DUF1768 family)